MVFRGNRHQSYRSCINNYFKLPYLSKFLTKHRLIASRFVRNDDRNQKNNILTWCVMIVFEIIDVNVKDHTYLYRIFKMISPIFTCSYITKYFGYTDETVWVHWGVKWLCVYQRPTIYLFLYVRYRISNLGCQHAIQPTQMIKIISPIFTASYLTKYFRYTN